MAAGMGNGNICCRLFYRTHHEAAEEEEEECGLHAVHPWNGSPPPWEVRRPLPAMRGCRVPGAEAYPPVSWAEIKHLRSGGSALKDPQIL